MINSHKILIVEDDEKQSGLLTILLEGQVKFKVTGIAASYEEAVAKLKSEEIDLCIVDINLNGRKTGIDVINHISENYPNMLVLVNTVHSDSAVLFDAVKAGAGGYILKGIPPAEILDSINRISQGEVPISPSIARKILASFKDQPKAAGETLTEREIELLKYSYQGYQHKQIAEMLNLSTHTVYTHFKNIYEKLHVNSRKEALQKAKKLLYL